MEGQYIPQHTAARQYRTVPILNSHDSGFELQWALWAQANPGALPGQQMHAAELGEALCLRRNEVRSRLLPSNFEVHDMTGFGLQGLGVLEAR